MPEPIVTTEQTIRDAETFTVSTRRYWEDDWTEQPHLFPNWLSFTANPSISAAEFEWRYGEGMRHDEKSFDQVDFLDLARYWVKIEVYCNGAEADPLVWIGIVQETGDNPQGTMQHKTAGVARMLAYGPELLLERQILATSWVEGSDGPQRIGRGLVFNDEHKTRPSGGIDKKLHDDRKTNRSPAKADLKTGGSCYVFATELDKAEDWSPLDIVEYLLAAHAPLDDEDQATVPFALDSTAAAALPYWGKPPIHTQRRSLAAVLSDVMDRRRLLGYTVETNPDADGFRVRPFTYADADIDFEDGHIWMANPDQKSLDFDTALDIESVHVKDSASQCYEQVIASGARIVCCGSASDADGTLVGHYEDAMRMDYLLAASGDAGYAALDNSRKILANQIHRGHERLGRVFAAYGLRKTWDGDVGDGIGGTKNALLPWELSGCEIDADARWYLGDLRWLHELPLKTDHDYADSLIEDDAVADETPEGLKWHYRPTYAVIKVPATVVLSEPYCEIEKLGRLAEVEFTGDGAGTDVSFSLQVQPDGPGAIIRAHGGVGQHELAGAEFASLGAIDPLGAFDWTELIVTFAMEADRHVEVKYPESIDDRSDAVRIVRIDASEHAGLHYVAPGTVVHLDAGQLVHSEGGVIRDDRPLLEKLARTAFEWYGRRRQTLTLCYRQASDLFKVGDLITTIGSGETEEPIRTVISEVRIDFAKDDRETHRTTIHTQWAELDVLRLL